MTAMKKRPLHERMGVWLLYHILALMQRSYRFVAYDEENLGAAQALHGNGGYVLACWHEHVLSVLLTQRGRLYQALVSKSGGGRMVGYVCEKFGYEVVYGSQEQAGRDKGGARALVEIMRGLKAGKPAALTVDGSIGPKHIAKVGVLALSRNCGVAILPVGFAASRCWRLPTWDRLQWPKPFATIAVSYGEPLLIPADTPKEDLEGWQVRVGAAIEHQNRVAEGRLAHLGGR